MSNLLTINQHASRTLLTQYALIRVAFLVTVILLPLTWPNQANADKFDWLKKAVERVEAVAKEIEDITSNQRDQPTPQQSPQTPQQTRQAARQVQQLAANVFAAQSSLGLLGYDVGPRVTSELDDRTEIAIRTFQLDHGYAVDGQVTDELIAQLVTALKEQPPLRLQAGAGQSSVVAKPESANTQPVTLLPANTTQSTPQSVNKPSTGKLTPTPGYSQPGATTSSSGGLTPTPSYSQEPPREENFRLDVTDNASSFDGNAGLSGSWLLLVDLDNGRFTEQIGTTQLWSERLTLIDAGGKITGFYTGHHGEGRPVAGAVGSSEFSIKFEFSDVTCTGRCANTYPEMHMKPIIMSVEYIGSTAVDGTITGRVIYQGAPWFHPRTAQTEPIYTGTFSGKRSAATLLTEKVSELPPNIQEKLATEKQRISDICKSGQNGRFTDCGCYVTKYMDYRIAKGPGIDESKIHFDIATDINRVSTCVDEARVAEYYYPMCIIGYGTRDDERYCTCYANSMAKNTSKYPSISKEHKRYINQVSYEACREP